MGTPANEEKMARKIQALIAKAESTDSLAEREACFERAQELMLQYSINEAVLAAARPAEQRIKPTHRSGIIVCGANSYLEQEMRWLAMVIASDLGLRAIFTPGIQQVTVTVVGYESDIRSFEMMFTALHLDLSGQLEPKPDVSKSFDENVYILHEAGVKWRRIADLMNKTYDDYLDSGDYAIAGWKPERMRAWREAVRPSKTQPEILVPWPDGHRLINAYKRYCRSIGEEPRTIQSPVTYQRNFAEGYVGRICARLSELRRKAEAAAKPGNALVLRRDSVNEAFDKLFPPECVVNGKIRSTRWIGEARHAGRQAGDRANLNKDRAAGSDNRRQLG